MVLRPDEEAAQSEIERAKNLSGAFGSAAKFVAGTAATLTGAGLTARIAPFLSEYITPDLAIKGISKISPELGKMLTRGAKMGLDVKEGLDFLKEKIQPNQSAPEQPKEQRNIIEQYSPELHQFMSNEVSKGRPPIQAGAIAQNDKRFSKIIEQLSKDHKTPWSNILHSVYGSGQYGGAIDPQQPQQQGQGIDPALMQIMQQMQATMQKFKGQ